MSRSMNRVTLIGHLGADPEVSTSENGTVWAVMSLATSESYLGKDKQRHERTDWHRVLVLGRQAEIAGLYLTKGSPVFVDGKLRTRQWVDKDGQKRTTVEIEAWDIRLLAKPNGQAKESGDAGSDGAE